jgi:nucleotide-binding universal stress UspA family protein
VPVWGAYAEGEWYDENTDRELRSNGQAYLDRVLQRLATVGENSLSENSLTSVLLEGSVAGAINRHAVATEVDVIVMTTHGRGPMARFWLGSVADSLIRQTSIPVLFVQPQETEAELTQESVFTRVLIPLDGSQLAEQILEPAMALATAMRAEVTLLRVVEQLTPASYDPNSNRISGLRPSGLTQLQEVDRQEWSRAEEYLDQLAARLRSEALSVQTRVISHLRPATAILDDASSNGADLIALATHGRGGLKRLLVGSVADKVVRGTTTPVLVYRPTGEFVSAEE